VSPDAFQNVLHYIYKGEIQLSSDNVENIFTAAGILQLAELKQICVDYMLETLNVSNCLRYWKLADTANLREIAAASMKMSMKDVSKVSSSELSSVTQGMLQAVVADDDLQIANEVEVCELVLRWMNLQKESGKSVQAYSLLSSVRWSDVSVEYVKSKLLSNSTLNQDAWSFEFLSKVVSYKMTGIQSLGIRTFHRPSTGQEQSVVIVGVNPGDKVTSDVYRLSLPRKESVTKLTDLPTKAAYESAACVVNDALYMTGVGSDNSETWMWTAITGWSRCGDLVQGRRRHCVTNVSCTHVYVLGGFVESSKKELNSIEQYNRTTNRWKQVGQLTHPTDSAACAVHNTCIYVFGGMVSDTNTDLDITQLYETSTNVCTVLTQRLPQPERLLRAVQWEKSIILVNGRNCLVFDTKKQTCEKRDQFAAGVVHFGLVLENQNIFVIGGGNSVTDKDGKTTWTCSDEVKSVPVIDIINNQSTANWNHHATLQQPSLVQAFSVLTLGLPKE
jgi:hypothetical protein